MMTDIKADESSEESEDENSTVRSLSCKMQRKVFSVLAKKKWARHFLSDALVQFLDQLYSLLKVQYSAKDSKKIVNNIIRLFGKVYLLSRGEQLSPDETRALNDVERQLRNFLLTMISFHDLDYTYDPTFLSDKLDCICTGLTKVVDHHLTEKSKARILMVGRSLRNKEFLDSMYKPDSRVPDVDSFFLCAKQLIDKWET
ncbi:hypothetical protein M514_05371, partial [Trichuris suis]